MANATSIFNKLASLLSSEAPLKERLDTYAIEVYKATDIKLMFCRLFGPRWAYFAGVDGEVVAELRIEINAEWGILAEGFDTEKYSIDEIKKAVTPFLE